MSAFRLKMATQRGEQIAAEFGFKELPVKPREIAQARGIEVVAKPPDMQGVSGAIIFAGNSATIIYSTEHANEGFENFSISHELGHWFLEGHPDEIAKTGGYHVSRADFTQNTSIELEADHFASGLLMPSHLVRRFLSGKQVGMAGILDLAKTARCSITAAAIRAAECSAYPMAIIVSKGDEIAYSFTSNTFKDLGKLAFLRKGAALPLSGTRTFNAKPENILNCETAVDETDLATWFDGSSKVNLDEEIIGLGKYGFTLTVLSSDALPEEPSDEEDEDGDLERSWDAKFAYGR